jgi:hypothetical protein
VDVHIDTTPVFSDVTYLDVTHYASVAEGQHLVQLFLADFPVPILVFSTTVTVTAGFDYSVAAAGMAASISSTTLIDDNSAPPVGSARVRFVHLSPDTPAVDVGTAGGPVLFHGIAFLEASAYEPVPAGSYTLTMYLSGTITPALALFPVTFQADTVHTVFAMGLLTGPPSLQAVLTADCTYTARVFLPVVDK